MQVSEWLLTYLSAGGKYLYQGLDDEALVRNKTITQPMCLPFPPQTSTALRPSLQTYSQQYGR
jgi:hypothetical protein